MYTKYFLVVKLYFQIQQKNRIIENKQSNTSQNELTSFSYKLPY